ncbi:MULTISPECIES: hypothetical protein [unclassified Tolypothrix]|uniref:hypothetical protein n=1 Tax=unclassified Tolypothrix TaxID=2649714 RepID=UPI0005EAB4BC|nr:MULTISPECIES: hypothetical protein [unclassified Tolypothrix]EKE97538.1 hypothetical protein FDUTEX481_04915 [Tolypothrix sp. PCC 7601]UYD33770.1 hypothetical protein HG267_33595 [Tolypothrix sp. PCC 7601]
MGRARCPPHNLGGQDVHPTINTGIFFYLEVPKLTPMPNAPCPMPHAPCQCPMPKNTI